ncbi:MULTISPECIES: hypothetical protein [unclassified Flagellimonas]|uniref:Lipoprotein n=1 Tax=Flagellimonas sp. MMG031 TaxID=3158549 RepID=A0AAU7N1D8_9FLAO
MEKHFAIFLLVCFTALFFSCNNSLENNQDDKLSKLTSSKIFSDKFLEFQGDPDFEVINLENVANFNTLIDRMQTLSCKNKYTGITYQFNDTIYNQYGYTECPTSGVISCFMNSNQIHIKNDSLRNYRISSDKFYSIESLTDQLKTMNAVDYYDSGGKTVLKQILIFLHIEEHYPISKTKEVLAEIQKQFDKANETMGNKYYRHLIFFEKYDYTDIPPPPPPPEFLD